MRAPLSVSRWAGGSRRRGARPPPSRPVWRARGSGRQGRTADQLTRRDFVILDELGYLPFAQAGGQLLFHLMSRLYQPDGSAEGSQYLLVYPATMIGCDVDSM